MLLTASSSLLAGHPLWHLAGGVVIVILISVSPGLVARYRVIRRGRPAHHRPRVSAVVWAAAAGSIVAGGIHAAVCPEHFRQSTASGVFFLVCALLQVWWAGAIVRDPSRRLFEVGAFGQAATAWLWVVSRTVGVPFGGPAPWHPERPGLNGIVSTVIELGVAGLAAWLALRGETKWHGIDSRHSRFTLGGAGHAH